MKKILFVMLLAACGARTHAQTLHDAVTNYHDGIRWDRLSAAAIQVPPKEREDFMDQRDELGENLKVSDWEIEKVRLEGSTHARVQVKLTWYADDEGVVHETQAVERWEKHGKVWWIIDEHRSRGAAMPGLAEAM